MESFEHLANETMNQANQICKTKIDKWDSEFKLKRQEENDGPMALEEFPARPGLLYRIDHNERTYVVRTWPVLNIKESLEEMKSNRESEGVKLLFKDSDPLELESASLDKLVSYFVTDYKELAEVIADHVGHYRFPLNDGENIALSDPDLCWWLNETENSLVIFTNFPGRKRDRSARRRRSQATLKKKDLDRVLKLGPLGSKAFALKRFSELENLLDEQFGLKIRIDQKSQINFEFNDGKGVNNFKEDLKNLFMKGENWVSLENAIYRTKNLTLLFYILEITGIRKFWIDLEKKIHHIKYNNQ